MKSEAIIQDANELEAVKKLEDYILSHPKWFSQAEINKVRAGLSILSCRLLEKELDKEVNYGKPN